VSAIAEVSAAVALRVESDGVWHRYGRGRGLARVAFGFDGPGVVVVTGPNGSGKSTLLRIVAGLLRPTGGGIVLRHEGAVVDDAARRRLLGYAAPAMMFYDEFTVEETLRFACETRGDRDGGARIARVLEDTGLADRANDRTSALSSGMLQRLRLAFATLHDPPVLLLDEPGAHLDNAGRSIVERLVDRRRAGGLVLLATNDEREMTLGDQRLELRGGHLGNPA